MAELLPVTSSVWPRTTFRRNPPSDVSKPFVTLSINLTTRSITGSGMSGVIPLIHRCTPHQNLMCGSLLPTSLKLPVTSSAGELRTAGELTPVGLGEAHVGVVLNGIEKVRGEQDPW